MLYGCFSLLRRVYGASLYFGDLSVVLCVMCLAGA